jgi:transcriptional regulator with XRE-family HTH domain
MQGLGKRIKELRKSKKMTLVEIAKKTGIDQATLSRMENGKMTGTLDSHMRLAQILGVRLPDLYNQVLTKTDEKKETNFKQRLETFSHSAGATSEILTTQIFQKKMKNRVK